MTYGLQQNQAQNQDVDALFNQYKKEMLFEHSYAMVNLVSVDYDHAERFQAFL